MTEGADRLVAIEGTNGGALWEASRRLASDHRQRRPCVSAWDASGTFKEVSLATVGSGEPSARTLLLLYAADLAFRLRSEITPALEAGRLVIAAPYVDTAIAFGQAAGLDAQWVSNVLAFAPKAARRESADALPETFGDREGFVEFCCVQMLPRADGASAARYDMIKRTASALKRRLEI